MTVAEFTMRLCIAALLIASSASALFNPDVVDTFFGADEDVPASMLSRSRAREVERRENTQLGEAGLQGPDVYASEVQAERQAIVKAQKDAEKIAAQKVTAQKLAGVLKLPP